MEPFSSRLKWLRESKGLSQRDLAEKLNLSQPYYGRFERNQGEPNLETLAKLPEILGESVDFMIGVTDVTKEIESVLEDIEMMEKSKQYSSETIAKLTNESERPYRESTIEVYNLASSMLIRFNERLEELKKEIPKV